MNNKSNDSQDLAVALALPQGARIKRSAFEELREVEHAKIKLQFKFPPLKSNTFSSSTSFFVFYLHFLVLNLISVDQLHGYVLSLKINHLLLSFFGSICSFFFFFSLHPPCSLNLSWLLLFLKNLQKSGTRIDLCAQKQNKTKQKDGDIGRYTSYISTNLNVGFTF